MHFPGKIYKFRARGKTSKSVYRRNAFSGENIQVSRLWQDIKKRLPTKRKMFVYFSTYAWKNKTIIIVHNVELKKEIPFSPIVSFSIKLYGGTLMGQLK